MTEYDGSLNISRNVLLFYALLDLIICFVKYNLKYLCL